MILAYSHVIYLIANIFRVFSINLFLETIFSKDNLRCSQELKRTILYCIIFSTALFICIIEFPLSLFFQFVSVFLSDFALLQYHVQKDICGILYLFTGNIMRNNCFKIIHINLGAHSFH